MEHAMILSASGWRKVFSAAGDGNDKSTAIGTGNTVLSALAAQIFSAYLKKTTGKIHPVIVCGRDTRPTGPEICDAVLRTLLLENVEVQFAGITAAPEIMAYSRNAADGFIYISASHNPVGYNGIKFGGNDGGVLDGRENAALTAIFEQRCKTVTVTGELEKLSSCPPLELSRVYENEPAVKKQALSAYTDFIKTVITGTGHSAEKERLFKLLQNDDTGNRPGIVADMNGSARTLSVDKALFDECGIPFYPLNATPGDIRHAIIPEPENLVWCAEYMTTLRNRGRTDVLLGYMPDCDGDRGNIVFWDEQRDSPRALNAQEVFSLSVLAVLSHGAWMQEADTGCRPAVVVNGPTSMRIDEIADAFGAPVFRAEVGEANVVGLARKKRKEGFCVRILGEGSNGGTIVHPEAVRDPLNTVFLLIQLLTIRDRKNDDGSVKDGLFHLWCKKSGQPEKYKTNFTLSDIIKTLPVYTTTGVSEPEAMLRINSSDHGKLKSRFQQVFESDWKRKKAELKEKYGICSYRVFALNGTVVSCDIADFGISGNGGLKIIFYSAAAEPIAFMWMRGSKTEPIFRVMCDVKGSNNTEEKDLLQWETYMLARSDDEAGRNLNYR
jgi:phosphoglucomutase